MLRNRLNGSFELESVGARLLLDVRHARVAINYFVNNEARSDDKNNTAQRWYCSVLFVIGHCLVAGIKRCEPAN
jgi:hypothetical protein